MLGERQFLLVFRLITKVNRAENLCALIIVIKECADHFFFFLFFSINTYAQELDWLPIPYSYIAKDENLTDILVNFSANYDSAVIVSHKVNEQVSGHFAKETPKAFLQQLSNLYNLTWYYDGSVLYVFKNSEVQSKLIKLKIQPLRHCRKH